MIATLNLFTKLNKKMKTHTKETQDQLTPRMAMNILKEGNMNPANYKLSREVLQEMLDGEYNKNFHKFETIYDREVQGKSPADVSQ